MIIRHATIDDAKPIVEFLRQLRAEGLRTILRQETVPSVHEEARSIGRLNDASGLMLIAVSGNAVIGCLTAEIHRHPQLRHSCEFGISVLKAHRSVGVGSALINCFLEWVRAERVHRVELKVFSNNPDAIRLYQRLGFREEGRKTQAVLLELESVDHERGELQHVEHEYIEHEYVDLVQMVLAY